MPTQEVLSSVKNPAVVAVARLHRGRHRRAEARTVIEGPAVVAEAIAAGVSILEMFGVTEDSRTMAESAAIPYRTVTESVLRRIAGTTTPRGPVAVLHIPAPEIPDDRMVLVAWGVADPGNCGTLVRTAAAFGYGYVAGPASADSWSPKVLRSAAGGHFHTSVGEVASVAGLGNRQVIGSVPHGGEAIGAFEPRSALIVGSEAQGLPPDVVERCDRLISIPMANGVDSLNAGVAGAIAAYLGAIGGEE